MSKKTMGLALVLVLVLSVLAITTAAQMKKPDMVTLEGKIIDVTCSAKAKAMMNSWYNAENNEHMMEGGKKMPGCAEMCLRGGQPAGLFDGKKIVATFACNPRTTLADYASQDATVMGFWGGGGKSDQVFVPAKIKGADDSEWKDVDCATMH